MREKRLLHARREHAVELEALRGVHGHERDCLAVFPHGVQIGTQAHPFDEIGKRIPAKHARRFRVAGNRVPFRRRGELRVVFLMRLRELVDDAHELLDVLDAPARFIGVLVGERRDEPRAIDDHLHHAAQLARVLLSLLDKLHELAHRAAGRGAQLGVKHDKLSPLHERHAHLAGKLLDALDGGLADSATRHVDDALRSDVVGGVHDQREIRHDVADFRAIEELCAADDAVGHARAQKHVFKHARLGVRAVKNGNLVVRHAGGTALLDLARDPTALVALVGCHIDVDLLAVLGGGKELLRLAVLVVRDDGVRGGEHIAHTAVVLLEFHCMAVGIVLLELEDVADVGTAPRVNGLVVVAHDHDVFVLLRQKPGDSILRMVRVLIFIHHDVTEALLVCLEHIGVVLQQQIRVHEQVIEVESVRSTQTLLQSRVDSGGHLPHRVNRLLLEITRHNKLVFRLGDAPHEGVYGKALRVDVELGHDFLVQALLIVGVVDGEALREAEALGVGAQHAHAHTVEGRDPHATAPRPDDALKALAHLSGGLVGEGDRKYFPRRHVQVLHEMGDAIGEHARLARACASEYQKRAFRALDSFGLRAIQRGDVYGHRYLLLRTANGKCADAQRGRARKASRGRHRFMCRSALYRSTTRPVSLTAVAARKPQHLFDYGRIRMEIAARKAPLE